MSRSRGNAEGRDPKTPLRPGAAEARRSDPRSSPTEVISQQCPHMVKKLNWLQVFGGAEPPQSLDMERYGKIHCPEALTNGKRTRQGLWRTQGGRPRSPGHGAQSGGQRLEPLLPHGRLPGGGSRLGALHVSACTTREETTPPKAIRAVAHGAIWGPAQGAAGTRGLAGARPSGNAPPMYLEQDWASSLRSSCSTPWRSNHPPDTTPCSFTTS